MKKITLFIITIFVSFLSFSQQYEMSSFYNAAAFDDISTTGTALNISDDGEENITTSFPITLGNDQSTQLRIGNNGAILFGTTTENVMAGNVDLETYLPMIAPFWDDLDDESGNVYWQDNGSLVIIQWDRPHYNDSSSNGVFQVKFFNSGDFYFIYQDVDFGDVDFNEGADATIGIATSQEVFQFSKNTISVYTDFVIKFEPLLPNNNCDTAKNLIVGTEFNDESIVTTNVGSTYTTGVDPSCVEPEQPEIWFTVTVPDSGNLIIETQPVDGSDFNDSIIAAFTGTCDNLTELACNDDSNVEDTYFSLIELSDLTPGDILYITAYSFEGEPFGEFKISAYDSSLASIQNNTITDLSIYPNPVENTLFIKTSNTIDSIQIYNMLGQVVLTKSPLLNNMELDLSNLSSGNYIVKVQSNNQIGTYKIVKN
jgi:hypothetical protein